MMMLPTNYPFHRSACTIAKQDAQVRMNRLEIATMRRRAVPGIDLQQLFADRVLDQMKSIV